MTFKVGQTVLVLPYKTKYDDFRPHGGRTGPIVHVHTGDRTIYQVRVSPKRGWHSEHVWAPKEALTLINMGVGAKWSLYVKQRVVKCVDTLPLATPRERIQAILPGGKIKITKSSLKHYIPFTLNGVPCALMNCRTR